MGCPDKMLGTSVSFKAVWPEVGPGSTEIDPVKFEEKKRKRYVRLFGRIFKANCQMSPTRKLFEGLGAKQFRRNLKLAYHSIKKKNYLYNSKIKKSLKTINETT